MKNETFDKDLFISLVEQDNSSTIHYISSRNRFKTDGEYRKFLYDKMELSKKRILGWMDEYEQYLIKK